MQFSLFRQNGAQNSGKIFDAVEAGLKKIGFSVVNNDLSADVYVIWSVLWHGRMENNKKIWKSAKIINKPLLIIEVGGLKRGITWRLGLNHINNLGNFYTVESFDQDRPKKLGIILGKRQEKGENILICGQNTKSLQWEHRQPFQIWLTNLVNEIRTVTDRRIVFRPHPRDYNSTAFLTKLGVEISNPVKIPETYDDFNLDADLKSSFCVVSPCSNPGITAAIAGIPVYTDSDSLAYPVSIKNIKSLENPILPDRSDWLIKLTHTEWTVGELETGVPFSRIFQLS